MIKEHILIAEDDAGLLMSLSFVLKGQGYEISSATDGRTALDIIDRAEGDGRSVDLLITDIQMPVLTGIDLIKELGDKNPQLPVIVITGHGEKDMLIELLRLGCDEFLAKPFEPGDILDRVESVLERKRLQTMARDQLQADLRNTNTRLTHEMSAYRRDYQDLRQEMDQAIDTYREFINVDKSAFGVGLEYRVQAYKDLGGDYFGVCRTETGLDVLVCDVAGHDLAASYQTILIKSYFDENCRLGRSGQDFFQALNANLLEQGSRERMVTAQFLRLNLKDMTGEVVSAGHPRMILAKSDVYCPIPVSATGNILGMHDEVAFEAKTFALGPGDRLFLYTDGVVNAHNVDGPSGNRNVLGEEGLENLVSLFSSLNLDEQVENIWKYVLNYCRYKQLDDMLLLGLEVPGPGAEA